MSIHDDITIKYELSISLPNEGWQTKGLDCNGSSFILTKDGRLLEQVRAIELRDEVVRETGEGKNIDRNFEGVFNVYRMIYDRMIYDSLSGDDEWYEFEIVMIDGNVKRIKRK